MTLGDTTRGIAASKSCHLSINTEFIEVCSPVDGSWKEYLPSIKSWSANVDTIVASLSDHKKLFKYQDNNQKLVCCFFDANLQEFYKGYCYIKNLDLKATVGSLATMTVSIQPTGKLEWAEEEQIKMEDVGRELTNFQLEYLKNGSFSVSYNTGNRCYIASIPIENDTRITLLTRGVIVKNSLLNVIQDITNFNNDKLKSEAILVNENVNSVIIKGEYGMSISVIINSVDAHTYNEIQATYLSKF